ncbi:hypothetical protein FG379_001340 [Cryptosporidium bovis]|uniref:uncharacterized protein n=1 Tax=Cryptosporidium bovis TaxID=310047 RepID=UPI00351A9296|nr:hypothetical protein FG379_001340 [Cryptosporidium bovis]
MNESGSFCSRYVSVSENKELCKKENPHDSIDIDNRSKEIEYNESSNTLNDNEFGAYSNDRVGIVKSSFSEKEELKKTDIDLNKNCFEKITCCYDNKNSIYLRSDLLKVSRDENNEVVIHVPCKLNMDLESLFYYFSNNSIYLNCEQFANMLHNSKLYHKSKPIDILERMFPKSEEGSLTKKKCIEFNSFMKLLHQFSQFKFRSTGATEQEKLNLVVSFLLNCDIIEVITTKLIKSNKCIQVNDPTMQRKEKEIQTKIEKKDISTQFEKRSTFSIGIDAVCKKSDACCGCNFESGAVKDFANEHIAEHKRVDNNRINVGEKYHAENRSRNSDVNLFDSEYKVKINLEKKGENDIRTKESHKQKESESEILTILKNISEEDDKKLFRIFVYYSGPNNDRLSYRQFYNLINDSGLLGGNFEEFLTPVQIERCYSAVLVDPKGVDYWEFKEILLYCGEVSFCGSNPIFAFQSIVKKYIIPLILTIYQPNNFEKCEDVITNNKVPENLELKDVKSLQSMINRAILPWFRLGKQPFITESDEYSESCSCSNHDSECSFSGKSGYSSSNFSQKSSMCCKDSSANDSS